MTGSAEHIDSAESTLAYISEVQRDVDHADYLAHAKLLLDSNVALVHGMLAMALAQNGSEPVGEHREHARLCDRLERWIEAAEASPDPEMRRAGAELRAILEGN